MTTDIRWEQARDTTHGLVHCALPYVHVGAATQGGRAAHFRFYRADLFCDWERYDVLEAPTHTA